MARQVGDKLIHGYLIAPSVTFSNINLIFRPAFF